MLTEREKRYAVKKIINVALTIGVPGSLARSPGGPV